MRALVITASFIAVQAHFQEPPSSLTDTFFTQNQEISLSSEKPFEETIANLTFLSNEVESTDEALMEMKQRKRKRHPLVKSF